MTAIKLLRRAAVVAAGTAILAQAAAAAGEPKNEWPFTRPVGERTPQAATLARTASTDVRGEPKNELPFTRPVGRRTTQNATQPASGGTAGTGEPKNEPPFVQTAIVSPSGQGFDWTDGAIGGMAGTGIGLLAAGLLLITHKTPHPA
jgi:hypothetical protein